MTRDSSHRALTIFELLVSLAILSAFILMSGSWLITTARASESVSRQAHRSAVLEATVRLLEDDLFELRDGSLSVGEAGDELQFESSHFVVGQRPGWARIVWRFEQENSAIHRSSTLMRAPRDEPDERIIAMGILEFSVNLKEPAENLESMLQITFRLGSGEARELRMAVDDAD